MEIKHPTQAEIPALWALWQDAFGDEDGYLEIFFNKAFAPERALAIFDKKGRALAALYWFDCILRGEKIAYIFGVSVASDHRGKGYCKTLMEAACNRLTRGGYRGAALVPARAELYPMYANMGFQCFGGVAEKEYCAAGMAEPIFKIGESEYTRLRKGYLPAGGVEQGGENAAFLAARTKLYAGEDFVFSFLPGENGFVVEFLGNLQKAPAIVRALGREKLLFRTYGKDKDFAVYRAFDTTFEPPEYFGIPFDF